MNKPVQKVSQPYWDYHEVIDYIEKKYNIDTRGYKREVDGVYRDFWHWIVDMCSIHNGSYFYLDIYGWMTDTDLEYVTEWQQEILKLIYDEFQEEDMRFWVSW